MNNFQESRGAMTVDDFCHWASIGRNKAYEEAKAGRLKMRKIGRKTVITMADATNWLAALPEAA